MIGEPEPVGYTEAVFEVKLDVEDGYREMPGEAEVRRAIWEATKCPVSVKQTDSQYHPCTDESGHLNPE